MTIQTPLRFRASAGLLFPLLLGGCLSSGSSSSSSVPSPGGEPQAPSFVARFDPAATSPEAMPFPTNLAFIGTTDGTLNLPTSGADSATRSILQSINDLDGWSTVAPIEVRFNQAVDARSLPGNIEVIRTTMVSPATAALLLEASASYQEQGTAAAVKLIDDAVGANAHAPLSGHQVPLAMLNCDGTATSLFSIGVSATDPHTVLLKPTRPLAAGDELDCLRSAGTFYDAVIYASQLTETAFSNGYVVAVSDGVNSVEGLAVGPDAAYRHAISPAAQDDDASVAGLKSSYGLILAAVDRAGLKPTSQVLSFAFTTQSSAHALDYIASNAGALESSFELAIAANSGPLSLPNASIYRGLLYSAPYYLNNKPSELRSADGLTPSSVGRSVLSGQWTTEAGRGVDRFSVAAGQGPVATDRVHLPVLLTLPTGTPPAAGWPVVIYQHGLGSERVAGINLAPLLAARGWAMIAIDHPLHGITSITANPFASVLKDPQHERHFYLDLDDNGVMDASGDHATPTSPATTRDVRRQTVADLLHLIASLPDVDAGGQILDASRVSYVGISMGGVIGSMLAGVAGERVQAYSLNVPGGGMAKMFDGSPVFAARSRPVLAAQGLDYGTKAYEDYFSLSQVVQDSGDPINYALRISESPAAVHMVEMIGTIQSQPISPPDLVLPNDLMNGPLYSGIFNALELSPTQVAETAPLSGTTPLWNSIGLAKLVSGRASGEPVRRVVRYTGGSHFSLHLADRPAGLAAFNEFLPVANGAATMTAVQRQTVEFLTTSGNTLTVSEEESSAGLIAP